MAPIAAQKERGRSRDHAESRAAEVVEVRETLKMLYELLEDYAPSWYNDGYHKRAEAAVLSCWTGNPAESTQRQAALQPDN
jgi:hypothetical protein